MATRSGSEFELWFRGNRPAAQGAPRLLCLPHAGGAAGWYDPLAVGLAPRVRMLAAQYPGRQDRHAEPCARSIGELADRLFEVLDGDGDERAADVPTVLFGHSMGGIVAFELARRLEAAGRMPALLIVSGRRAPSTHREWTVPQDDEGLIERLTSLGGTDAALLEYPEILELILPAVRADYRALGDYRRPEGAALSCPIVAMIGDRDPEVTVAEAEAWATETSAGFDLRIYPGGHFYLAEQAAEVTAAIEAELRRFGCLEAAAAGDQ